MMIERAQYQSAIQTHNTEIESQLLREQRHELNEYVFNHEVATTLMRWVPLTLLPIIRSNTDTRAHGHTHVSA